MQHSVALPASAAPSVSGMPFESRASGGEYFRIWIVNLLLTVLTLGIYSAWAKVRSLRYFYGTTSLDGTAFEYHGTGLQILKGRLIAFGVLAIYSLTVQFAPVVALIFIPIFFFGLPWVIVKARTFQMRVSSWRNVRFNFHGTYGGAMAAYIGWALLAVVTLYTLVPLWLWKRTRYIVDNTTFGAERFRFATPMGRFFAFWYIAVGLGIAALIVFSFVFGAAMAGIIAAQGAEGGAPQDPTAILEALSGGFAIVLALVGVLAAFAIGAYYQRSFTNAVFDGMELGEHRVQCNLRFGRLFFIHVTNFLGMLLTLGLFYPWARVRLLRYQVESMGFDAAGSLDRLVADNQAASSAIGEEFGEAFDVNFGL
jgi:uncharacterized membrane protein YjgN (DUF898 family)